MLVLSTCALISKGAEDNTFLFGALEQHATSFISVQLRLLHNPFGAIGEDPELRCGQSRGGHVVWLAFRRSSPIALTVYYNYSKWHPTNRGYFV